MIELNIREAKLSDSELYLQWRNDSQVRASAFTSDKISLDNHLEWYSKKIENHSSKLYLIDQNSLPVGQVRFELNEDKTDAEINYSIAKDFRGKHMAVPLMKRSMDEVFLNNPKLFKLIAKVKIENIASNRVFEKLSFNVIKQPDHSINVFEYTKNATR